MHWGIRRYQNADGSLTSDGISRYNKKINALQKKSDKLRKKAEKYKKKSTWKLRSREGYVKYSLKSGKKSVKADKIDAKISNIKKTLLSSNKKNIDAGKKEMEKLSKDPQVKDRLNSFKKEAQYHDQLVKKGENIENYLSAPKSWDSREPKSKIEKRINSAKNSSVIKKAGAEYFISRNEADTNTGKVSEYFKLKANQDKKKFTKLLDDAGVKYNMKKDIDVEYGPMYLHKYMTNKQRYIYDRY